NVVATDPRADAMRRALRRSTAATEASAPPATLDADAAARLRALGYAASSPPKGTDVSAASSAGNGPPGKDDKTDRNGKNDPKRLVALNERFNSALTAFDSGDRSALSSFQAILRERPDFLTARTSAAAVLVDEGRGAEAVRLLGDAPVEQRSSPELLAKL